MVNMNMDKTIAKDVIIIGAGGAGLMAAVEAGKRGRRVLILEHNEAIGKKIRISGGGRCNFTNINAGPDNYLSQNPHFAKSALARFTPDDFCEMVKRYKIAFHEKTLGQLFCDLSSQYIITMLSRECEKYKVDLILGVEVTEIKKEKLFTLTTTQGIFTCQSLIVATGGLSIPTLGATDFGYKIAKQFHINVNHCLPGLVPLTFRENDLKMFKELSGVSLDTIVSFGDVSFHEKTLFTHRGLSGPAILQISSYWKPGQPIIINLLPHCDMSEILKKAQKQKATLRNFLKDYMPARLAEIMGGFFIENKPLHQYSLKQLEHIAYSLHHWEITPKGTEGYAKAEVTLGGINTDELSSKTMEAKKVPGLFFVGEVVDVTGWLGGYNFQWAWASGFAAGQYA